MINATVSCPVSTDQLSFSSTSSQLSRLFLHSVQFCILYACRERYNLVHLDIFECKKVGTHPDEGHNGVNHYLLWVAGSVMNGRMHGEKLSLLELLIVT